MYLAIDPGKTTGFATFDENGELQAFGQLEGVESFTTWLESAPPPSLVVFEDYIIDPSVPQGGSDVPASQIIGVVRSYCTRFGICAVPQSRTKLKVGYAWAGLKPLPKSRHRESHQFDAIAHGTYYLVSNGIAPTALERQRRKRVRDLS